jgi:hypothetical protein
MTTPLFYNTNVPDGVHLVNNVKQPLLKTLIIITLPVTSIFLECFTETGVAILALEDENEAKQLSKFVKACWVTSIIFLCTI